MVTPSSSFFLFFLSSLLLLLPLLLLLSSPFFLLLLSDGSPPVAVIPASCSEAAANAINPHSNTTPATRETKREWGQWISLLFRKWRRRTLDDNDDPYDDDDDAPRWWWWSRRSRSRRNGTVWYNCGVWWTRIHSNAARDICQFLTCHEVLLLLCCCCCCSSSRHTALSGPQCPSARSPGSSLLDLLWISCRKHNLSVNGAGLVPSLHLCPLLCVIYHFLVPLLRVLLGPVSLPTSHGAGEGVDLHRRRHLLHPKEAPWPAERRQAQETV